MQIKKGKSNPCIKKNIFFVSMLSVMAIAFVVLAFNPVVMNANATKLVGDKLLSEYVFGTELQMPEAKINVNGEDLETESILHFPSGKSYRKPKVVLNEDGEYTMEYRTTAPGKEYREYKTFMVYNNLYDVKGGFGASVAYEPSYLAPKVKGINLQLASGSKFYYNQVIDLNALDEKTPFLSAFISPSVRGELDASTLCVRLTDVHDSTNYITYKCNSSRAGIDHGVTYILCGGAEQTLTGVEWGWGRVHRNNVYGHPIYCSFYGKAPSGARPEEDCMELYFDTATNVASANANLEVGTIVDLDDPAYFPDSMFFGFTTGEVKLSIWAEDFVKTTFGLEIVSVAGQDLSASRMVDSEGPVLKIDYQEYKDFPEGIAGYDYPLFGATARDSYSGDCEVKVKVYENYHDGKKFDCYVENGVFKPEHEGIYTIEYTTRDYVGNTTILTKDIKINKEERPLSITIAGDKVENGYIGERIKISDGVVGGGIGKTHLKVSVYDPLSAEVKTEKGVFLPEKAGDYKVEYVASDFVGQKKVFEYTVKISKSDNPVFSEDPKLPEIIFGGFEYTLPELKGNKYVNGREEVKTNIYVKDSIGTRKLGKDRKIVFNVKEGMDHVTVIYTTADSSKTSISYDIPCVQAFSENGDLILKNYFNTTGIDEVVSNDSFTSFYSKGRDDTARLEFMNSLLDEDLTVGFIVDTQRNAYSRISITLSDSEGTKVTAFIDKTGNAARLSVGNIGIVLPKSFKTSPENQFTFKFDQQKQRLTADGINYLPVMFSDDGSEFKGFAGHRVKLSIEMCNITGKSAINIVSVNSHLINNATIDLVAPRIFIDGVYGGSRNIGDIVTLNDAYVTDVVDPSPTLSIRVIGPDGKPVEDLNNRPINNIYPEKDLSFEIKDFGTYAVYYIVQDSRGLKKNFKYNISVIDDISPVIKINSTMKSKCSLNEVIIIPEFTVSDNITSAENICVLKYIILPTGRIFELPENSNSFKASYKGDYVVCIVAYDEAGNQTIERFSLDCA